MSDAPAIYDLINHNCLDHIILYLDVKSLLILAATNHFIQNAIVSLYERRFGTKKISLNWNVTPKSIIEEDRRIIINGANYCFPFLRLFSAKISELIVVNDRNVDVDEYISRYCANTLSSITFNYRSEFSANDFSQPFHAIETVRIIECDLGPKLRCFPQWFPNVRCIRIYKGSRDNRLNRVHFPHLEDLYISFTNIKLLRANPQLRNLVMHSQNESRKHFLDLIVKNRLLLKLAVKIGESFTKMNRNDVERLIDEHPLIVELDLPLHRFNAENAIRLIRGLNSLQKFEFRIKNHHEYNCLLQRLNKDEWRCVYQMHINLVSLERRN